MDNKEPIYRTDDDGIQYLVRRDAREKGGWTDKVQGIARRAAIHDGRKEFKTRPGDNMPRIANAIREAIESGRPGLLNNRGQEKNVLNVIGSIENGSHEKTA